MSSSPIARTPNRLIHETSPYLLQHAYNPVDWYPWGPEALQRAKETNRPILLSIGYSACHWCHVMERESFEDKAIAELMNQWFVCIKVDREERPDLDEIYMAATVAMNHGQGGWPMTVFLTPAQEPFFAGTYFPPEDRWGRPGFGSVLKKIADYWDTRPSEVRDQAQELTAQLQGSRQIPSPISISESVLDEAIAQFRDDFDETHGGFGTAPKFPPAMGLSFLLRSHRRSDDPHTLTMVTKTLDMMAAGGIYDHIGGGFARYSTDARWLVPHFEKMLYDNALLARVYVEAYQVTKQPLYRQVACEILDYVRREMTGPEGGFYSSTDADSEGVEGKFFVWTPTEVQNVLKNDEEARRFCALYDITKSGNWEHTNIPNRLRPVEEVAKQLNLSTNEVMESASRAKPLLYEARRHRVHPGLDDKIITAWNGMMLSAMAEAARVFGNSAYLEHAQRTADFLLRVHAKPDGRLLRTSRENRAHLDAYLEDYAFLTEGLLDLYEAGAAESYLHAAARLADYLISDFMDQEQGGFFTTARHHESLILRHREGTDGAVPSANAVAASALARLSFHCDRADWRRASAEAIRAYGRQMTRYPRAFAKSLAVVDFLTEGPVELAMVGHGSQEELGPLRQAVGACYLPNRIIATGSAVKPSSLPLLKDRPLVSDKPTLYICRNYTCRQPITDPHAVADAVRTDQATSVGPLGEPRLVSGTRLSGCATIHGTAGYASRIMARDGDTALANGLTTLGATGWTTTRIGFGTYRVDTQHAEHRDALKKALRTSCNLIDTSTNYTDGDSERLVGSVLAELVSSGEVRRDEIVIVSKIGYIQGQNLKIAEAKERSGHPYPDMVKYGDGIWHCIHPEFLADQLTLSLDRLGLMTLDVCLLHNPEYFLSEAKHHGAQDLQLLRKQFYARIEQAFTYFETQIAAGRLQYYGVSSNTVASSADDPDATSLSRMLEAAEAAARAAGATSHHFQVMQCPMNLFEPGPTTTANTGPAQAHTVLDYARRNNIAVLVNRPLNAMVAQNRMLRLAALPIEDTPIDLDHQLNAVATLEQEYRTALAPKIPHAGSEVAPTDYFQWSAELQRIHPHIQGLEHWEQIEHHMIAPQVNHVLQLLSRQLSGDIAEQWERWRQRYIPELLTLLRGCRYTATLRSRAQTDRVVQTIGPLLPTSHPNASLSQHMMWILTSTPGVTCVLNGMRTPKYVEDSTAVLKWEPIRETHPIHERASTLPRS